MAAGLSKSQIASRIRTRLKKIAAANGGEYVAGSVNRRPCGIPVFDVWSDDVPHSERHTLNGLTGDLQSALETFRAARDQALTYVVLPSQAGGPGDAFDVGPEGMTDDLGRARWAQQQTSNRWNLWRARKLDDSRVRLIREYPYTDDAGIAAMKGYIAEQGVSRIERPALSKRQAFNRIFIL